MRTFTLKERIYMRDLAFRNAKAKSNFKTTEGLHKPMTAKERMMRLRIKKKAKKAMVDLNYAEIAGIIDSNKLMQYTMTILLFHLKAQKDRDLLFDLDMKDYLKDADYEKTLSMIQFATEKGLIDEFKRTHSK
jgi:predicted transcriptional regulator